MYLYATKPFFRPKMVKQLMFDARKKVESGKVQKEGPKKKSPSILRLETRKTLQNTPESQPRSEEQSPQALMK